MHDHGATNRRSYTCLSISSLQYAFSCAAVIHGRVDLQHPGHGQDHFRTPAFYADTKVLLKEAADADALILAVDHLPLVPFGIREDHVPVQEALSRLQSYRN